MKGYKWMTSDMRAFYDGYQYHFGWNEQEGKRDGKVCVSGGFHINKYEDSGLYVARNNKCDPHEYLCNLYEVYYLKRDILGQDGEKIRVSRFKLLKKKPVIQGSRFAKHKPYIYIPIDDTSSTTNYISTDNTYASNTIKMLKVNGGIDNMENKDLEKIREELGTIIASQASIALILHAKYDALIQAGFSKKDALYIIAIQGITIGESKS